MSAAASLSSGAGGNAAAFPPAPLTAPFPVAPPPAGWELCAKYVRYVRKDAT